LRQITSNRSMYDLVDISDSLHIQIRDEDKKVFFTSRLSVTSDNEKDELIEECIKKLPYCKLIIR